MTGLVHEVLESNREMSDRLTLMEATIASHRSVKTRSMAETTRKSELWKDDASILIVRPEKADAALQVEVNTPNTVGDEEPDFEGLLYTSRPYIRALKTPGSSGLIRASGAQSLGWSFFSGISLAEVSNISVIELAINRSRLWNPRRFAPRSTPGTKSRQVMDNYNWRGISMDFPRWPADPISVDKSEDLINSMGPCRNCVEAFTSV